MTASLILVTTSSTLAATTDRPRALVAFDPRDEVISHLISQD